MKYCIAWHPNTEIIHLDIVDCVNLTQALHMAYERLTNRKYFEDDTNIEDLIVDAMSFGSIRAIQL